MSLFGFLKGKAANTAAAVMDRPVSTGYQQVKKGNVDEINSALRDSWKDASLPEKQRAIVDPQLKAYREGGPVTVFDALVDVMASGIGALAGLRVLEIGCSSGYYAEIFAIKRLGVSYEGCDYSAAFVEMARRCYPDIRFEVQDAVALHYGDASFDVVVSGGCILHIPDYERAIAEAVRVSRRWVIFHRTPIVHTHGPVTYTKKAYDVDTVETHFNERALVRLFSKYGLHVADINTYSIEWDATQSDALAWKTYLCEKLTV